jgi:hypothetical protein
LGHLAAKIARAGIKVARLALFLLHPPPIFSTAPFFLLRTFSVRTSLLEGYQRALRVFAVPEHIQVSGHLRLFLNTHIQRGTPVAGSSTAASVGFSLLLRVLVIVSSAFVGTRCLGGTLLWALVGYSWA